ncbi:MAG: hypothetical protein ACTSSB_11240 [Candidatus Heimdallarchaeota archaeon]
MKFKNTIVITFLILVIGISPFINVNAKTLAGTLYSRPSEEPIIDGYLNDAAWSNGISQGFTLYNHANVTDIIQIEVMSIYSEFNHITFGISIYDDNFIGNELLVIFFSNNASIDLVQFHDPLTPYLEDGNDAKGMYIGTNSTFDCYTDYEVFDAYFDFNVGGDEAKSHIESSELVTMELDMLFQSADVPLAYDVEIDVGDEIEIFFWYLDNAGYYSGYLYNTTDYEYGILNVGGLPPTSSSSINLTTTALILSVVSVNLLVILIAKKKKK